MKYTAEMFGASWSQGPRAEFSTIREAREWAESYGTTADSCTISDASGKPVAVHRRDPNGNGHTWFEANP